MTVWLLCFYLSVTSSHLLGKDPSLILTQVMAYPGPCLPPDSILGCFLLIFFTLFSLPPTLSPPFTQLITTYSSDLGISFHSTPNWVQLFLFSHYSCILISSAHNLHVIFNVFLSHKMSGFTWPGTMATIVSTVIPLPGKQKESKYLWEKMQQRKSKWRGKQRYTGGFRGHCIGWQRAEFWFSDQIRNALACRQREPLGSLRRRLLNFLLSIVINLHMH